MQTQLNLETPITNGGNSLFGELCTTRMLVEGWIAVKNNRGAPGIDGQTTYDFENNLAKEIAKLSDELVTWTYKPQPVRRVEIPKPDGSGMRNLGVPCVRDRVVQATIKLLLEPILDPLFSEHSYGFRPGKGQQQAVTEAQRIVESGKEYIVDIDLEKFFDKINHDYLIARLSKILPDKRILRLIGEILRSGVMHNGLVSPTTAGSTQGSPLSPLLSNFVLDELDKELERRGLEYCRYADDCNIFVKTQKAAERVMDSISRFIEEKLKLKVNKAKSKTAPSAMVKFLGITIINKTRAISRQSMLRVIQKVKELIPRGTNHTLKATIERINSWYRGWSAYYAMTQYPAQLKAVEAHIRRRLRSRLVGQQKSRRNLFNKLLKHGVKPAMAAVCFTNKKRWSLSHSCAVEQAFSNRWFEDNGLFTRSNEKRADWFYLGKWIKLP